MAKAHLVLLVLLLIADQALAADGKKLFSEICQICHQVGGKGAPGLAPPLVSKHLKALAQTTPDYVPRVALNGLSGPIEVEGVTYQLVMPPQQHLSDSEIAAVSTYVLATLNGQKAVRFTEQQIKAFRAEPKSANDLRILRKGAP